MPRSLGWSPPDRGLPAVRAVLEGQDRVPTLFPSMESALPSERVVRRERLRKREIHAHT